MNKPFSLSKNERIKSKKTIETLFRQGEAFFSYPYRMVFILEKSSKNPGLHLAFSVPKRYFKRAHDRNRIKRITREACRLQKQALVSVLMQQSDRLQVMMIYQAREVIDYATLYKHMHQGLLQLQKRVSPHLAIQEEKSSTE